MMKNKKKKYIYRIFKVKHNYLSLKHERLKQFGFDLFYTDEGSPDTEIYWAKGVTILSDPKSSPVAEFMKHSFESIYKRSKKNKDKDEHNEYSEYYINELREKGLEFDEDDNLIINEAFSKILVGQLCVQVRTPESNSDIGCLFLNMDSLEFYDAEILEKSIPNEIAQLYVNDVIYKKKEVEFEK